MAKVPKKHITENFPISRLNAYDSPSNQKLMDLNFDHAKDYVTYLFAQTEIAVDSMFTIISQLNAAVGELAEAHRQDAADVRNIDISSASTLFIDLMNQIREDQWAHTLSASEFPRMQRSSQQLRARVDEATDRCNTVGKVFEEGEQQRAPIQTAERSAMEYVDTRQVHLTEQLAELQNSLELAIQRFRLSSMAYAIVTNGETVTSIIHNFDEFRSLEPQLRSRMFLEFYTLSIRRVVRYREYLRDNPNISPTLREAVETRISDVRGDLDWANDVGGLEISAEEQCFILKYVFSNPELWARPSRET